MSLVLHGTSPFQVYYRTQRDKEPEKEGVKTFTSSRGEITLQPLWSGHYVYTFFQLSDVNYQRVALNGPTIEQVVHPLATAEFASGGAKKMINSCSGNVVDIDISLRVRLVMLNLYVSLTQTGFFRGPDHGTWKFRSLGLNAQKHYK